jgi:D-Tyr-tRNAtyr deacylase
MCGDTARRTLHNKTRKGTGPKFYKAMAVPTTDNIVETWNSKNRSSRSEISEEHSNAQIRNTKTEEERNILIHIIIKI